MKQRNKTNRCEVYLMLDAAGKAGATVASIADALGVRRSVVQQHLWRMAKRGVAENLVPGGGSAKGRWVIVADPHAKAEAEAEASTRDISDTEQRWLRSGQYDVQVPKAPNSVWALAR